MASVRWDKRFLASTRGQIVALLRRQDATVNELAEVLELTPNAVRAHLASLERDGLAEQRGVRRGTGKPANVYGLAAEAERLFPKAYSLILGYLLDVLAERVTSEELDGILAEVGRRVVAGRESVDGVSDGRLAAAVALIADLGGLAEVETREGRERVQGYSCPFALLVPGHPEICRLAESAVSEVVDGTVRQRCVHGDRPQCAFELVAAEGGRA
ncbi:MAG TPA: ArsR family transcriptional regulator [Longimicrobiales bacterium]